MDTFTSYPTLASLLTVFRLRVRRSYPVLEFPRPARWRPLTIVLLSAGLGACAGRAGHPAGRPDAAGDPCELAPAPETPAPNLTIVVTAPIDAGRLWLDPNPAERFVLAHAYETLVRVDCTGAVRPGLATEWRQEPTRGRWVFTLREETRFWNGERVTAAGVLAAWRETAQRTGSRAASPLLDGASALDDRTLAVPVPGDDLRLLADPAFLVRRERPGSPWPEGTGPYRLIDDGPDESATGSGLLRPLRLERMSNAVATRLTIHSVSPAAARDLVDVGVDLLLSDAADLIAYAESQPGLDPAAFAWSRRYVLVTTAPAVAGDSSASMPDEARRAERDALARDVVRANARGSVPPWWWEGSASCVRDGPGAPSARRAPGALGIAYDRTDPTARALAERLAAVAAMGDRGGAGGADRLVPATVLAAGSRVTAVGLAPAELANALRDGVTLAYVIAVPVRVRSPCLAWDRLVRRAPWLDQTGAAGSAGIVPLVETRWTLLHGHDRLGVWLQWDGTPIVVPMAAAGRGAR